MRRSLSHHSSVLDSGHCPHVRGIRKDLYRYKGEVVNFEEFDFADGKIIRNHQLNKLYFMKYYTELYINGR